MPASLADITAMATLRSRKSIGDLALASAMIVLSDLLTLAASRWVNSRKQQLAAQALANFAREIHAHRQRVLAVNPYDQALAAAARQLDSLGATHAYADWKRRVPAWFGFRPPAVTTTAWQTALTTGARANLPYRQVGALYREGKLNAFIVFACAHFAACVPAHAPPTVPATARPHAVLRSAPAEGCADSVLAFRRVVTDFQSRQQNVAISVGVLQRGKIVFREAAGFANKEAAIPADPSIAFSIASITKAFTGAALLKLVEEGRIDLDAEIQLYVPEFPQKWSRFSEQAR